MKKKQNSNYLKSDLESRTIARLLNYQSEHHLPICKMSQIPFFRKVILWFYSRKTKKVILNALCFEVLNSALSQLKAELSDKSDPKAKIN
jgi:hypothetical protein